MLRSIIVASRGVHVVASSSSLSSAAAADDDDDAPDSVGIRRCHHSYRDNDNKAASFKEMCFEREGGGNNQPRRWHCRMPSMVVATTGGGQQSTWAMASSHAINGCRDNDDEAAGEKKKNQRRLTLHEGDVLHRGGPTINLGDGIVACHQWLSRR